MQVVWTAAALRDVAAIRAYIAADNPTAAARQTRRILARIDDLNLFPLTGRTGRIDGTRELVVSRPPYLVAYRLRDTDVEILRILHGRQRWPDRL
jgi:toxin ParE1/3/4